MAGRGTAHLRDDDVILRVEDLVVDYRLAEGTKVQAVSGVSFDLRPGETLGLVGESGCGKSSTGKAITMLIRPTSGSVTFDGHELTHLSWLALRRARRRLQTIFQDPISSLNPRRKVRKILAEALAIQKAPKPWDARVEAALRAVGLDPPTTADRTPRELSGGQSQRVAIARSLLMDPAVIVCDEPVSALDVSVQAQILNLLEDLKQRFSLSLLFISHDLAVVKHISDRVAVMYLGRICEVASSSDLYERPQHPYTQALLSAIPEPDPFAKDAVMEVAGDLPSPIRPPSGCRFHTRCPRAEQRCSAEEPLIREIAPAHYVACHFPGTA